MYIVICTIKLVLTYLLNIDVSYINTIHCDPTDNDDNNVKIIIQIILIVVMIILKITVILVSLQKKIKTN